MTLKKQKHILSVDDQANWRSIIKEILETEGYKVSSVSSYEEASSLINNDFFDIAILDMRLIDEERRNIQGMALLKRIKETSPQTKAIILTGYPEAEQRDRALNYFKADAYIEKVPGGTPFDITKFKQLVESFLE